MSPRWFAAAWLLLAGILAQGAPLDSRFTLVETGAVWRYLDAGQTPASGWKQVDFDDSGWKSGRAPFGYGRGNEATLLDYGPNPATKPITSYFRLILEVEDLATINRVTLLLIRDDAAVVYFNGVQLWRSNMDPYGPLNPNTPATNQVTGLDGVYPEAGDVSRVDLTHRNVIAVELHQYSHTDPDAWFAMPVIANSTYGPPSIEWISPTNGSVLPLEDIVLQVNASDDDSSVWRVEYLANGNLLGTSYFEPFNFAWYDPPRGRYHLRAEAVDNTGRRATTRSVVLQFGDALPDRVIRGPYLQTGTPYSMVICWRTDWLTSGRVWYGSAPEALTSVVDGAAVTFDHEVQITGLAPATKYYYGVGTETEMLSSGPDHFFVTSPVTPQPTRIWVIGDSGKTNENTRNVYQAYRRFADRPTDLWLMLGDNAYESGTDDQYQKAVFEMYTGLLPNTVLWPTIGNHDQATVDPQGGIPYLNIFCLPRLGEAGGIPSGTERYYSFDHHQIHFICLDSSGSARTPGSPMLQWLESDLSATTAQWIIAFWHHPPYTFGSHNSDSELDLVEMRENVVPILESYGVDLVLSGHSHNYERSFLLQGHYGRSGTLEPDMILDHASGNPGLDHAYQKSDVGSQGTVYTVCGCSGEGGAVTVDLHPAMYTAFGGFGSMVVDVDGTRLEARMVTDTGGIRDMFVIEKEESQIELSLRIRHTSEGIELSWPTSPIEYQLEATAGRAFPWVWEPWPDVALEVGGRHVLLLDGLGPEQFFRLRAPE